MAHHINICEHGVILSQCRCPSRDKTIVRVACGMTAVEHAHRGDLVHREHIQRTTCQRCGRDLTGDDDGTICDQCYVIRFYQAQEERLTTELAAMTSRAMELEGWIRAHHARLHAPACTTGNGCHCGLDTLSIWSKP